jgi:hypothetical protein
MCEVKRNWPTKQSPEISAQTLIENCCWCLYWIVLCGLTPFQMCLLWKNTIPFLWSLLLQLRIHGPEGIITSPHCRKNCWWISWNNRKQADLDHSYRKMVRVQQMFIYSKGYHRRANSSGHPYTTINDAKRVWFRMSTFRMSVHVLVTCRRGLDCWIDLLYTRKS